MRVRPPTEHEKEERCIVSMKNNTVTLTRPIIKSTAFNFFSSKYEKKTFEFSKSFWSYDRSKNANNETIFDTCCKPLVQNLFEGYNSTLFAYGQTGSGKSYTIEGQMEEKG